MTFTIGADPEFFLYDKETYRFVSPTGILPAEAKKGSPMDIGDGINVLVDGMTVEYNIPPATTPLDFLDFNMEALKKIRAMIDDRYAFAFTSAATFQKRYYNSLPFGLKEVGCDPFFNADPAFKHDQDAHERLLREYQESTIKFAGGHIHVGWGSGLDVGDQDHISDCMYVVKNFRNMILDANADTSGLSQYAGPNIGRSHSGAGRGYPNPYHSPYDYRPKSYGVELRGFNNEWLNSQGSILNIATHVLTSLKALESTGKMGTTYWSFRPRDSSDRLEEPRVKRAPKKAKVKVKEDF